MSYLPHRIKPFATPPRWVASFLWLALISAIALFWKLGSTGLVDETEPLFAEAARQMLETGDWVTPYFNETTRFDKPPLIYWLMAIAYRIGGVNAWSARLPSALAAVGLTLMGFYTLLRFGLPGAAPEPPPAPGEPKRHWRVALVGATAIVFNLQTVVWGRTGVSDMLLSGCMGSALFAFFLGYGQPERPRRQRGWFLAFYILIALAILTKGPVGIVLPGIIVGSFLLYLGNWRALRELRPLLGIALILGLTLPWYALVIRANGQTYIDSFFGYHNLQRFTQVVNNHSAPWYFYFLVVTVGFIPWSMYLPWGLWRLRLWRVKAWRQQPRHQQLGLFAAIWFAVVFAFFTVAVTKLPSYTIPLLPAAAVLVAPIGAPNEESPIGAPSEETPIGAPSAKLPVGAPDQNPLAGPAPQSNQQDPALGLWRSGWVNALFCLVLAVVVWSSAPWMGNDPAMPRLPEAIAAARVLWWGAAGWLLAAALSAVFTWRRSPRLWLANVLGFGAFLLLTLLPALDLVDAQRQRPLRQIAATIAEGRQEEVVMVGFQKPSLVFYTQRPVTYRYTPAKAIAHIRRGKRPALLVGRPEEIARRLTPDQYDLLAEAGTYQLVRVYSSRL